MTNLSGFLFGLEGIDAGESGPDTSAADGICALPEERYAYACPDPAE